jgi:uncharacterized FlaG/YvyC family protein
MSLVLAADVVAAAVLPAIAAGAAAPARQPSPALSTAVQVDAFLRQHQNSVRFQVDPQSGMTIVNIYNEASGEIVQQIPNEVVVRIAQYLRSQTGASNSSLSLTA